MWQAIQHGLLPAVKLLWRGLGTPRCLRGIALRTILVRQPWVLHRIATQYAIIVLRVVVVGVFKGRHIVHVWIKQVVEINGRLVVSEVRQEKLVVDRKRVQRTAHERVEAVPFTKNLLRAVLKFPELAQEFEVCDDVAIETESHLARLFRLLLVLLAAEKTLLLLA